ncbi:MAG TPA: bifunctional isocitrate dehydrogenase kinase/phosphatase [Gemmatimonadaceae bacterium]|nr:bifunctional isocitrate dehydrogenase kinase/phosphatase [Gemmatimonadaceae bacterium]
MRQVKGNRAHVAAGATAADAVALVHESYEAYRRRFHELTCLAKRRFETRDWPGAQRDATDRLALYKDYLTDVRARLADVFGDTPSPDVWREVKARYAELVRDTPDGELARTFFNSVTRRFFTVIGVEPDIEFTAGELLPPPPSEAPIARVYERERFDAALVREILTACRWDAPFLDLEGDSARVADVVRARLRADTPLHLELIEAPFYRNKGVYLVGRIRHDGEPIPLVLAVLHDERGIFVDAVLMTSDEASVVFGFSWRYFRVDVRQPRAMVDFLSAIMPLKRVDELYTAIGFNRHGKAELYRALVQHLAESDAQFDFAEGDQGLVMSVFTFPSFNVVFKIIKDTFGQPKRTTRRAVMEKYHLVFLRDRVGRLADAQEFQYLEFRRQCFTEPLLAHLQREAAGSVKVDADRVIITHLYTERRVTPLNLYLRDADDEAARHAIRDYGRAIKELAGANIFTGDMLLKNFGVSRHERVIFYDYDELTLLTDCVFRELPQARHLDEEMSAEPWYYVGEHDVFPEEFVSFLVPPGRLRDEFLDEHADLLTVRFWREMQERQRAGEIMDVFPYRPERRLRH